MAQQKGTVAWFNNLKGFGFIKPESGPDVFVHFSAILDFGYRTLSQDDPVEFDIVIGPAGKPQAEKVKVLDGTPSAPQKARAKLTKMHPPKLAEQT